MEFLFYLELIFFIFFLGYSLLFTENNKCVNCKQILKNQSTECNKCKKIHIIR